MNIQRHKELVKLSRNDIIDEIVKAYDVEASTISRIVELFYDCQEHRKRHAAKKRTEEKRELDKWFDEYLKFGETLVQKKLTDWIEDKDPAAKFPPPAETRWAYAQYGIGPIISAGLASHIDIERAKTPSAVWKYAGFAPGYDRRIKGKKLPFNGRLKTLCWKMSDCFVKFSNKEECFYGKIYREFKDAEIRQNEAGLNKERAEAQLREKKWKGDTETKKRLMEGKLSDAHLENRARRRVIKIFLVHYWEQGRKARGLPVRQPYIQTKGHDGIIPAPPPVVPPADQDLAA